MRSLTKLFTVLLALPLLAQQSADTSSEERDRLLGRQLASSIKAKSRLLGSPAVDAYVDRIGRRLLANLPEPLSPYSFEVITAASGREPMAFPGGPVLIPAPFLVAVQDEAELAGMLAHAIGHVALRHSLREPVQFLIARPAPFLYLGGWMGSHADPQAATLPLAVFKSRRAYELEADAFGISLAARSGFAADGLRRYIERTEAADSSVSPEPAREMRLARMDEILRPRAAVTVSPTDEFQQVQAMVRDAIGQP
jgi:predicted Zn-dependent protease